MEEVTKEKKYYDFISVAKRTTQDVYFIAQHDKNVALTLFLQSQEKKQRVVVCKSKKNADALCVFLKEKGIASLVVHGNHRAEQIKDGRASFETKDINILITTDMILKALELKGSVEQVISFDLPLDPQNYFSRLRLVDEVGEAISFASSEEERLLADIEFAMRIEMNELELTGFTPSQAPTKEKKNKKPRHSKKKSKKEDEVAIFNSDTQSKYR